MCLCPSILSYVYNPFLEISRATMPMKKFRIQMTLSGITTSQKNNFSQSRVHLQIHKDQEPVVRI